MTLSHISVSLSFSLINKTYVQVRIKIKKQKQCTAPCEKSIKLGPGCDSPSTHVAATMPSLPGTLSTRAWVWGLAQEVLFVTVNRGGNGQGNHRRTRDGGRPDQTGREKEGVSGREDRFVAHALLKVARVASGPQTAVQRRPDLTSWEEGTARGHCKPTTL